jgi:Fe-S cluster assembly protein SufD
MAAVAERHEALASQFDAFRRDPAFGSDSRRQAREQAFQRFLDRGFPTSRDEEWKFTPIAPLVATSFVRARAATADAKTIQPFLFADLCGTVVLVNGRFSKDLSSIGALPAGITVTAGPDTADPRRTMPSGAFVDLNEAFFEDAVTIRVAPRTVVTTPLQVLSLTVGEGDHAIVAPRLSIHVGEGAQASIIESYAGMGTAATLTAPVTRIQLEAAAILDHVKIQNEPLTAFHLANMAVWLGRASTLTSHALTFGARIGRNDIMAVLEGEGAECTLDGLYVADVESLVDTHTTIDHAMPHCPSHERYRGILSGKAKAVFNGKIIVRPDAQKTDAKQTNRALLLSDTAQVNTKPQLEIFADDVKCTHGAAIGQLDDDALFYLQARGVSAIDARNMLIHAFAGEVVDTIKAVEVRERAMHLMEAKLRLA